MDEEDPIDILETKVRGTEFVVQSFLYHGGRIKHLLFSVKKEHGALTIPNAKIAESMARACRKHERSWNN